MGCTVIRNTVGPVVRTSRWGQLPSNPLPGQTSMTTTTTTPIDRAAINRRNAQKSTGPRTHDGKNRSRFNAVKHGMTAKTLVLPDEDADVLQMRVETWIADLQPQNDVEQFLVEQAVHASWKLERADRAEVAQLSRIIGSVPIAEANRQHEVVAALGDWLFSDRNAAGDIAFRDDLLNVLVPPRPGPPDHRCLDIRNHPEAIVFRLESTAAGCQWLLDRWTELRGRLDQGAPGCGTRRSRRSACWGSGRWTWIPGSGGTTSRTGTKSTTWSSRITSKTSSIASWTRGSRPRNPRRWACSGASRTRRWRGWRRGPRVIASRRKPTRPSKRPGCRSTPATRQNASAATSFRAAGRCSAASTP